LGRFERLSEVIGAYPKCADSSCLNFFGGKMSYFDHEKLDVCQAAIELVILIDVIVEHLPRGRAYLADQFQRAGTSVPLNTPQLRKQGFIVWHDALLLNALEFLTYAERSDLYRKLNI